MADANQAPLRGRGSHFNPNNRFARLAVEKDLEHLEHEDDAGDERRAVPTQYFIDDAKSVVSENDSPDIPFRYSLNPYRGCAHGCSYCFARPTHEYLDLSAGLDFETKIFVKQRAPELFRDWLARDGYQPEPITISGVTDCYQPIERKLRLTRRCLEVALEARQPVVIVTKNVLVTRDADLLEQMAALNIVTVAVSVTTLDQTLAKVMEPRTSSPAARLKIIEELSRRGVSVQVLMAPVIPGLTDHEIPAILQAVKDAGAASASYILLRLPLTVEPVFLEWLQRTHPDKKSKIESLLRSMRGGKLYEGTWGVRMRGRGEIAGQIRRTFEVFARKHGLERKLPPLDRSQFRPPVPSSGQGWLFT
jgi:DNA repair photolyase